MTNLLKEKLTENLKSLGFNVNGIYETLPNQVVNAVYSAVSDPVSWRGKTTLGETIKILVAQTALCEYLVKVKEDGAYICRLQIDSESNLYFMPLRVGGQIHAGEVEWFDRYDHPGVPGEVRKFFQIEAEYMSPNTWEFIEENAWLITEKNGESYVRMWDHQSLMEDTRAGANGVVSKNVWTELLAIEAELIGMDRDDPTWVRYDYE